MVPIRRHAADWRVYAAVGLAVVLIAAGFWSALWPRAPQLAGDRNYQSQALDYRPGGADCQPQRVGSGAFDPDAVRKADACKEKIETHRIEADQLIESRRAAQAAEQQAWLLQEQTKSISVATVFEYLALTAAGAAAFFAWRAAVHTRRAADVAEKTLTELERPYVFIESPRMFENISPDFLNLDSEVIEKKQIAAEWDLVNYGRSPATVLERSSSIYFGKNLPEAPIFNRNDVSNIPMVVPPQSARRTFAAFYEESLTKSLLEELFTNQTTCFLFVKIKYHGVQGLIEDVGNVWEYVLDINHWVPVESESYTYRRLQSSQKVEH